MGKFVNNVKEFFEFCKENEVKFVDFRFTDLKGTWHHVSYNIKAINEDSFNGLPFDGSSIDAWQPIHKSDMMLKPDVETAFLDPFTADTTIIVICDVYDIYKGELYEKCPRSIAKKASQYLRDSGVGDVAYFGPENEFFVFDNVRIIDKPNCAMYEVDTEEGEWNDGKEYTDGYNTGHRPRTKGGYFPVQPVDSMVDLRAEMVNVLEQVGLETFVVHHEVAQGQGEIGVKFGTLVEAADNVQIYKYVVKMVAHLNGKTATFMPKPLYGDNGSGMHVHQSIWKDGKNLFYKDGNYANLSDIARWYIGGVLKHARSVAAFTNPSTNSYKRLIPGFEAPSILTYSCQNRSASCRIPYGSGEKSVRAEFRFPDSTACPYLAFAAMLLAGLDGIKNKVEPVGPMDEDLFELTLDEIRDRGIEQLPHTLRGSLEAVIRDNKYLSPAMSNLFIETYQHYKFETQVWPYEQRPTPFEFKTSFSC
ncbi:type I glutamate--ammonia ligase [Campylobacter fetus]|uniref:Glutamine synthetase n=5 Tax=Campylobacter fetus TaxID=196 RepID=A0A5L4ICY1_CAMFE|nr:MULTISPECIES: type I glutamate--ammonia ligase [Campylobacter]OCS22125.1 glutamine synthetase [Campylobacter fetus subsp. venerealis cfvi97/532]OCS26709.1 glutamine synthetase [Campylobacter fetus subsp. venerealis cfvB10]OCS30541.1 glutamine synthetase [Campylobacter fetus subsp. venerealis LMG 6570 = CCUG 33900]OCS43059.1 glutamine synthetase [Campylobacter fetus subsp. venerealis cfvi02/298]ABK83382.1 glutamine synthetase, type I [Campylobacter fetus subsp. fetus 82-40]